MTPYYDEARITIYHGEALDTLRELPDAVADVLLTDPPYSSGGAFRGDRAQDAASKYRGWSQNGDGSKPYEFVRWMLQLLDYQEGDELVDIFPGSGHVAEYARLDSPALDLRAGASAGVPSSSRQESNE